MAEKAEDEERNNFFSHSLLIAQEEMGSMKANRKFIEEEAGVSAVIGVILMVAITVAIAATVYVYVSGMIGTPPTVTPNIVLRQDEASDYLMVTTVDQNDLDWSNVIITVNRSCNITSSWGETFTNNTACTSGFTITAGNKITFSGTTGPLEVTMIWTPTNTLIGSWKFTLPA